MASLSMPIVPSLLGKPEKVEFLLKSEFWVDLSWNLSSTAEGKILPFG
jgi:hypothetical protein